MPPGYPYDNFPLNHFGDVFFSEKTLQASSSSPNCRHSTARFPLRFLMFREYHRINDDLCMVCFSIYIYIYLVTVVVFRLT